MRNFAILLAAAAISAAAASAGAVPRRFTLNCRLLAVGMVWIFRSGPNEA